MTGGVIDLGESARAEATRKGGRAHLLTGDPRWRRLRGMVKRLRVEVGEDVNHALNRGVGEWLSDSRRPLTQTKGVRLTY